MDEEKPKKKQKAAFPTDYKQSKSGLAGIYD
jgi:hypothetical protein